MTVRSAFKPTDPLNSDLPDSTDSGPYHCLFEQVLGPILRVDADAKVCDANPAAADALGYSRSHLAGRCFEDLVSPSWRECSRVALERALGGEPVRRHETELVGPDGVSVPVLVDMVSDTSQGQTRAWVVAHTMRFRQLLERRQQLAHTVFDNSTEGIVITDAEANIVAANRAFTAITGYKETEVIGKNPRVLQSGRQDESFYSAMWSSLMELSSWKGEIWNRRKSGELYPEWLNISAVRDSEGRIVNFIGLFSDITSIKTSQERLDYLAHHDPLTGLPNRLLLGAQIEQALIRMKRAGTHVAVIYLDLDDFKPVNDRLGHGAGDDVLVEVANRLSRSVRDQDTVARLGGDEFAILLEGVHARNDTDRILQQIDNALEGKFRWNSAEFTISASVGISIAPEDGTDARTLLNTADTNMYQVKKRKHRER